MRVLVTGAAGFIGFHLSRRLLEGGAEVVGVDSLSNYYDVRLKEARLEILSRYASFVFHKVDLADSEGCHAAFAGEPLERVVHLAAQPGVRYSLENPRAYTRSNIEGFINVLEECRHRKVPHLVYASSSSVYGSNKEIPFSVEQSVDHPVSLYAATKKANELMAHTYSHLFGLPTTGLRFFTVYGPWGRPDMAIFLFTKAILEGKPIDVFNHGDMKRDFTYVDDIVEGVLRVAERIPRADPDRPLQPATSTAPYRIYNIGNSEPVSLIRFIEILEEKLGKKAILNLLPMQPGDLPETYADVSDLERDTGFRPTTPIEEGIGRFVEWYRSIYG